MTLIFISTLLCGASKRFNEGWKAFTKPFSNTKKMCEKKKIYIIFPPYSRLGQQKLRLCFCETPGLYYFLSLTIGIY